MSTEKLIDICVLQETRKIGEEETIIGKCILIYIGIRKKGQVNQRMQIYNKKFYFNKDKDEWR